MNFGFHFTLEFIPEVLQISVVFLTRFILNLRPLSLQFDILILYNYI